MTQRTTEHRPARGGLPELEVQRSGRRRRSASAFVRQGRIVVQLPAGLDTATEERLIQNLVGKVSGRDRAARRGGDALLAERAAALADRYLDGVRPTAITWSARMRRRWGSCTPSDGTIRISQELAAFPDYVLDSVLVHELAHLIEPRHNDRFRALVARFPHSEKADGFLAGVRFAEGRYTPGPDDGSSVSGPSSSPSGPSGSSGGTPSEVESGP